MNRVDDILTASVRLKTCRDCTFAKPYARTRAMAPWGTSQWRYATCQHMAAMRDNDDEDDLTVDLIVTGQARPPTPRQSRGDGQHFCSNMRRAHWLCGPKAQYFIQRETQLRLPVTVWSTPIGAVAYPILTHIFSTATAIEFLVGGMVGFLFGFMASTWRED